MRQTLALSLLLVAAQAQALPDDQQQAITIEADQAFYNEKAGLTEYRGSVFLQQGSLKVKADSITVRQNVKSQQAEQLVAKGSPASFEQLPELGQETVHANAKQITYNVLQQDVLLEDEAVLHQGQAKISSDKISYSAEKQIFKAEQKENSPGRVHVTLPPPKKAPNKKSKP